MQKDKINELVSELDKFFKNGGSHMNVKFDAEDADVKIIQTKHNECADGQNACGIPTEFFEDEEDV